ncbi:MAG: serine hydrolase domain-containing protein [Armatimonas sp.]
MPLRYFRSKSEHFYGEGEQELQSRATQFLQETGLPGVWIGVARHGQPYGAVCAGYADREAARTATLSHRIRLGSISKPVAASIYAALVEQGILTFDTNLGELSRLAGSLPDTVKSITARSLLTHTSGLPADIQFPVDSKSLESRQYASLRRRSLLAQLRGPLTTPGKESYSNVGFLALAVLIDELTGKSFEEWLSLFIGTRAGLSSFGVGIPTSNETAPYERSAAGITKVKRAPSPAYQYSPSGSIHATIADLTAFGLCHLSGKGRLPLFQQASFLPQIHSRISSSSHTLGAWEREEHSNGAYLLHHSGSMGLGRGDSSLMYVVPQSGFVVTAYTNCWGEGKTGLSPIADLRDKIANPIYHLLGS